MKAFNIFALMVFVSTAGFITYSLIKDSGRKFYLTTNAEIATVEESLRLSGFVYPSKEIEVKPQISGVVDAVFVHVGDRVNEGDPLASIRLVPNSSELEQLNNNLNIARINLSSAKAVYDRQTQLYEKKAISRVEFEVAEKEYLTANENYSTALNQLNLRQTSKNSAQNIVRSSTSGIIIDVPVKAGASVMERSNYNVGTTVAIIAGADHFVFRADVPEKTIRNLKIGMPVNLSLLAFDDIEIDASISKISSKGELKGGAVWFPIEADFTLGEDIIDLRSGYSASGEITIGRVVDVLTLPEKCINFKGDTTFVYVSVGQKEHAVEKIISIGISDGEKVEIVEGISSDDLIITNYHD